MSDTDEVQNFVEFCESDFGTTVMDREAGYIAEQLAEPNRILDVGCGIGAIEQRIREDIVGLDVSRPMLTEARRRTDDPYVQGDATTLPCPTDSFDAVISVTAFEFLDDYQMAIDEVDRILQDDGRIVILLLNQQSRYFQRRLEREQSYFHRAQHDPEEIADYLARYFDIRSEYFLGIDGTDVFDSADPEWAAMYALTC